MSPQLEKQRECSISPDADSCVNIYVHKAGLRLTAEDIVTGGLAV